MLDSIVTVIIISFLLIGCSHKKINEELPNETTNISSPISLSKDKIIHYYEVKRGDTLYSLGSHLKIDYKKIAIWNGITPPYKIKVGQKLSLNEPVLVKDSQPISGKNTATVDKSDKNKQVGFVDTPHTEKQSFIGQQPFLRAQMVAEVLISNPRLEIARAVWQASTARVVQQGALQDPVLAYGLAPLTMDSDSTDFVQQVKLSQNFPWPGKLSLQSDAAMHSANGNKEKIIVLQLELTALAKKLYGHWYFNHQAHKIHKENVQLLSHVNKIAKIRYRIGKASQQEVLQSELELSLIEQHKYILNQQKIEILGQINTLLGREVDTSLPLAKLLPHPLEMNKLSNLQKSEIENHPKIKALSSDIKAWELKKERAILAVFPNFNVNAGYSSQMANSDKHFTVGVAVNLPLDLSKYQAIEDEAIANLKRAQWNKKDQTQELAKLIQLYYSKVKKYQNTLVLYKDKILPLAKQNKLAALANYQAGSGGFLELIRAEKDWHSARLKEKQMLVDYHESLALFEYAVGITDFSTGNSL